MEEGNEGNGNDDNAKERSAARSSASFSWGRRGRSPGLFLYSEER